MNVPFKPANSSAASLMPALHFFSPILAANIVEIFERCGMVEKSLVLGLALAQYAVLPICGFHRTAIFLPTIKSAFAIGPLDPKMTALVKAAAEEVDLAQSDRAQKNPGLRRVRAAAEDLNFGNGNADLAALRQIAP